MDLKKLLLLAEKYEKVSLAQRLNVSTQPATIQQALIAAELWNMTVVVSPMLSKAGIPDDTSVAISIVVSPGPIVSFNVALNPENPKSSSILSRILVQQFSAKMAAAIKTAGLNVESPIVVKWITF